jgi:uncharacterized protein with NRDE domain
LCLIAFDWQPEAKRLRVIANRDEFYSRPTAPLGFWDDAPILAGRDLKAGGTWFGLSRGGRFAALTNVREGDAKASAKSRGLLVQELLLNPASLAQAIAQIEDGYAGYNLIAADLPRGEMFYASNRAPTQALAAGKFGLSNASLDTPWPKLIALKAALADSDPLPALRNTHAYPDNRLPSTGVPLEVERALSPAFIAREGYGTRSSAVLLADAKGASFTEWTYADGVPQNATQRSFDLRYA